MRRGRRRDAKGRAKSHGPKVPQPGLGSGADGSKAPLAGKLLSVPTQDQGTHPPTPSAISAPASRLCPPHKSQSHRTAPEVTSGGRQRLCSGAAFWLGSKREGVSPAGNPLLSRTPKPTWGPESHPGEGHASKEVQWGRDNFHFFSPDKGQAMGLYPGRGRRDRDFSCLTPPPHRTSYCNAGTENRAAGTCFHLREGTLRGGGGYAPISSPKEVLGKELP